MRLGTSDPRNLTGDEYYVIIEPCIFPNHFNVLADGKAPAELKRDLEKLLGTEVWTGVDPQMPDSYWQENFADDALIAKKPE